MTFVTRRGNRFEIRESASTSKGPRSTTLATFRVLTDEVMEKAAGRATGAFDPEVIRRRAQELGAPWAPDPAFEAGRRLAGELARGHRLPAALAAHLVDALAGSPPTSVDSLEDAVEWVGASVRRRAQTLWQLLELADAFPATRRPHPPLAFPRLAVGPE